MRAASTNALSIRSKSAFRRSRSWSFNAVHLSFGEPHPAALPIPHRNLTGVANARCPPAGEQPAVDRWARRKSYSNRSSRAGVGSCVWTDLDLEGRPWKPPPQALVGKRLRKEPHRASHAGSTDSKADLESAVPPQMLCCCLKPNDTTILGGSASPPTWLLPERHQPIGRTNRGHHVSCGQLRLQPRPSLRAYSLAPM